MSKKPIDSFFDDESPNFRLWQTPNGMFRLDTSEILFQGPLVKLSKANGELRTRMFVLTEKYLFYLFSTEPPVFAAVMPTSWIRVDYLKTDSEKLPAQCLRFVRNRRFTDLYAESAADFEEWKTHLNRVFWQCNFQSRFRAIKTIGKGSFAKVYLVKELKSERQFAVKAFSKEHLSSQKVGRQSLMTEIEILRQLKHKNIMCLEELHESRNSIYMVTELLQGGELLHHLTAPEPMRPCDQQKVIKALLEALAYMEERMIMHRDIKPTNILFRDKEVQDFSKVKLVDFGLATFRNASSQIFQRCGTPGFIAPEVINCTSKDSIPYSTNCDVFSVGVLFYIMLSGRSPFEGRDAKQILAMNKVCKVDMFLPGLTKDKHAHDLLFKMLEKNPDERITASEALKHIYFRAMKEESLDEVKGGKRRPSNRMGGPWEERPSLSEGRPGSQRDRKGSPEEEGKKEPGKRHERSDSPRPDNSDTRSEKTRGSAKIYLESIKSKNFMKDLKMEGSSFGVQDHLFKGTLQTVDESASSGDVTLSLNSFGSLSKKDTTKSNEKQNMLKVALLNSYQAFVDDVYQNGFTEEIFDSDEEFKQL
jgi:serine/threonine protein kinase